MIHVLNLSYKTEDAIEYFNTLRRDFQKLHWNYKEHHCDPRGIEGKNFMDGVHGWGLQTIYADLSFPYHGDIDPHDEGPEYFKDTEMVFGFFKAIKDKFEQPYRSFLLTFPPKHYIGKWTPSGPPHGKIFIPIITNNDTVIVDLTNDRQVLFELGKIYLFDMTSSYGEFKNDGETGITFITFNIPQNSIKQTISML